MSNRGCLGEEIGRKGVSRKSRSIERQAVAIVPEDGRVSGGKDRRYITSRV